jgi:hypothetical protein
MCPCEIREEELSADVHSRQGYFVYSDHKLQDLHAGGRLPG